jgi:ADP-ribose pyrophosphatase
MTAPGEIRDRPERWQVVSSTERFRGGVITVRSDQVTMPNGNGTEVAIRDVIEHPGSVGVLALDDEDRVLLIQQYRHPAGHLLWEAPAGLRDVVGEPLVRTAQRELVEEAGYTAARWHTLCDIFTSPGMSNERIRIFLARDLTEAPVDELGRVLDGDGRPFDRVHEEADMPVAWLPLDEAVGKALRGDIHNHIAIVGILAVQAARARGFTDLRPPDAPED